MAQHNILGKKGEKLAVEYLIEKGYKIIEQNYYFKKAEIDIIALKKGILSVVEVKTRSTDYYGNPESFVTQKKINLLVLAIDNFVAERNLDVEIQFDIIAIVTQKNSFKIQHFKEAFLYF